MSIPWYRNYGFRPPEVDPRWKGKPVPKYFIKDSCLTAPNMRLDNPEMFETWFTIRVRRVIPGLLPVPKPMRLPSPDVVAAMVKELLGYEPKGHTAEVVKPLIGPKPIERTLDEYWEQLRKEILEKGPLPMTTVRARMPLDHESIPRPFSSTCDGIYPIRQMVHAKAT